MEVIKRDVLQQFEQLSIGNAEKQKCKLIFEKALIRISNESKTNSKKSRRRKNKQETEPVLPRYSTTSPVLYMKLKIQTEAIAKQIKISEHAVIIRHTVLDIKKLNKNGEYSQWVTFGGFKWRMKVCLCPFLVTVFLCCGREKSKKDNYPNNWQCTASYDFRVLNQPETGVNHSVTNMEQFNKDRSSQIIQNQDTSLFQRQKDFTNDDTIHIEIDIVVIASSGIPRSGYYFENPDYQHISGIISHTFSNISVLDYEPSDSPSFNIGGFLWTLSISNFCGFLSVNLICDGGDDLSWSCKTATEYRIMKQSKPGEFHSEYQFEELNQKESIGKCYFAYFEDFVDPANGYIKNDTITVEAKHTILKPIASQF